MRIPPSKGVMSCNNNLILIPSDMENRENIKKKLEEDGLFTVKGQLNSSWLNYKSKKFNLDFLEGDSLQEKIYLLYNPRTFCRVCGKSTPFRSFRKGYYAVCSRECQSILSSKGGKKSSCGSEEAKKKRKETCLRKYGCENPSQNEKVKKKRENTNIKRYGVSNVFESDDIKERIRESSLDRYGTERACQSDLIKKKIRETNIRKYGGTGFESIELREKIRQTNVERFGTENPLADEGVKNRKKDTFLKKYGVDNPAKSDRVKEKARSTCHDRYGKDYFFSTMEFRDKSRESCMERYGVSHPSKYAPIRKKMLSKKGMTSPEKKMREFLDNRGIEFEYQYECNGKCFDFAVFRDGELSILIEIDGEYNHGLISDYDDFLVKGYNDCERFSKVPEGVKFIVCDSLNIEKSFSEILRVFDIDYELWVRGILDSLPMEFPYPSYDEDRMRRDYLKLCSYDNMKNGSRLADSSIRHFHRSIWSSNVKGYPSPVQAWNDRGLLEKCVRNRFIYSSSLSSQSVVNGFNVCKLAPKVSVFSASMAKRLVETYLSDYDSVFDPFSGFSGRMLGTCACGKKYIGQDVNESHVKESNEIIDFLNLDASVTCRDVLDSGGEYECLFTCPPYGDKEIWGSESVFRSCDEWIDECLQRFKCGAYLFVVDSTSSYSDSIIEEIGIPYHFGNSREKVICIRK